MGIGCLLHSCSSLFHCSPLVMPVHHQRDKNYSGALPYALLICNLSSTCNDLEKHFTVCLNLMGLKHVLMALLNRGLCGSQCCYNIPIHCAKCIFWRLKIPSIHRTQRHFSSLGDIFLANLSLPWLAGLVYELYLKGNSQYFYIGKTNIKYSFPAVFKLGLEIWIRVLALP